MYLMNKEREWERGGDKGQLIIRYTQYVEFSVCDADDAILPRNKHLTTK